MFYVPCFGTSIVDFQWRRVLNDILKILELASLCAILFFRFWKVRIKLFKFL